MSSADNERERGAGLSGRLGQARRNDASILASARAVFVANPDAPIAAVAEHAGVGIGALYRRYASKEDLLRKICADGLELYISIATDAVEDAGGDPWVVFATFMRGIVEADTPTLATKLAGRFSPTPEMFARAQHGPTSTQMTWVISSSRSPPFTAQRKSAQCSYVYAISHSTWTPYAPPVSRRCPARNPRRANSTNAGSKPETEIAYPDQRRRLAPPSLGESMP
jgi:AcrR family transcriptional regulator